MWAGVLGRPAVGDGHALHELGGRREAALLAVLTARIGDRIRPAQLEDELWEGRPVSDAALRVAVNRLRRRWQELGLADAVHTSPGGYSLAISRQATDAGVFEQHATAGRAALLRGELHVAVAELAQAEACWRGPAFDGFAELPSVRVEHHRLTEARHHAREDRATAHLWLGDAEAALATAVAVVHDDPYRESAWALRLVALARSGRRAEALSTGAQLERLLRRDLGVRPGVEVRDLITAIADGSAGDELLTARQRAIRAQAPAPSTPRRSLVGRALELAVVADEWDEVRATRRGRAVTIVGEPGVGKSAVLAELAVTLGDQGAHVLHGRCTPTGAVPLQGPLQALAPHLGPDGGDAAARVRDLLDRDDPATNLPTLRFRLISAVVDLVRAIAKEGGAAFLLDDAQHADPLTVDLLSLLFDAAASVPVLVVLTSRTTAWGDGSLGDVLDHAPAPIRTLPLGRLDREAVGALLGADVPAAEADELHRASGGNPLYLEQLRAADVRLDGDQPPPDVVRLCGVRLDRLPSSARALIEAAAVVGEGFDASSLAVLLDVSRLELSDDLATLQREELIEADGTFDQFRFVHGIIRHATYQSIEPGRRAHLHLACADLVAADPTHREIELLEHLTAAWPLADERRTVAAGIAAAQAAQRVGASEEAARLHRLIMEMSSPATGPQAAARIGLGLTRDSADAEARVALDEAWQLAAAAGDVDRMVEVTVARCRWGPVATPAEGLHDLEMVDEVLGRLDHHHPAVTRLLWRRIELLLNFDRRRADEAFEALQSRTVGSDDELDAVLLRHAQLRVADSRGEAPAPIIDEARELQLAAERIGEPDLAIEARALQVSAAARSGDLAAAARLLDDVPAPVDVLAPIPALHLRYASVMLAMLTRPVDEVDALSDEVATTVPASVANLGLVTRLMQLMWVRHEQRRLRDLEPILVGSLEMMPTRLPRPLVAICRAEADDADGGRAALEVFAEELPTIPVDFTFLLTMAWAAEAATELEAERLGRPLLERMRPFAPQVVVGSSVVVGLGHLDRYRGLAAALAGEVDDAIELAASARHLDEAAGAPLPAAWAAHDEAAARLRRGSAGDRSAALDLAALARPVAERYGSVRLSRRLALLADRAG